MMQEDMSKSSNSKLVMWLYTVSFVCIYLDNIEHSDDAQILPGKTQCFVPDFIAYENVMRYVHA